MESISVFDILKIGVGPSSSHTLGPWKAALQFIAEIKEQSNLLQIQQITIDLYGSLSLTGKGHATDLAILLGLSGYEPETIAVENITSIIDSIKTTGTLWFNQVQKIPFSFTNDIHFHKAFLPFHANGMSLTALFRDGENYQATYYSIGGGFVVKEQNSTHTIQTTSLFPFPIQNAQELLNHCKREQKNIKEIVWFNELALRSASEIDANLLKIWQTMLECVYVGCHTQGILPGGLNVRRRAFDMYQSLKSDIFYHSPSEWLESIRNTKVKFREILKWVSCFALAVNEVNASLGRVVTAPTNGSAGVIPAVLMYYLVIENHEANEEHIKTFLLVAGEIGSIFKKGATISAAMGGCQAEIGVSSAMAAGALCQLLGGSPEQVLIAAEIAMEHHLGLTCDPIAGLVQIPCIERNAMGAIKAINAAELALATDAQHAKVPLDKVIATMWETAKDMNTKYKETAEGGLAVAVSIADC